ncbi:type II toxin-antitoxin system RelE/ParE family toxin [Candidatus Latescibacterota bacterium]
MSEKIIFYETKDGNCPVADFLSGLPVKHHAKALRNLELLEEFGQELQGGFISRIRGKLWELRIRFAGDISRILYFIPSGSTIILLHGFIKKTQRTPAKEVEIALERMKNYLGRNTSYEDTTGAH